MEKEADLPSSKRLNYIPCPLKNPLLQHRPHLAASELCSIGIHLAPLCVSSDDAAYVIAVQAVALSYRALRQLLGKPLRLVFRV